MEDRKGKSELKVLIYKNNGDGTYKKTRIRNRKDGKEKQELEYLGDINEELKEENKKLKEEIDLMIPYLKKIIA